MSDRNIMEWGVYAPIKASLVNETHGFSRVS